MKNYSQWTNSPDTSFDNLYNLYEKDYIDIRDTKNVECIVDNANEWQDNVDYIFLINKDKGIIKWGDYLTYNNNNYLVNFIVEDRNYYWAAKSRLCNTTFPIQTDETKTLKGYDSLSRPVYEKTPIYETVPCIASKPFFTINNQEVVNTVDGHLDIQLPFTTHDIPVGYQFEMFGVKYAVEGVNRTQTFTDSGVIQIYADKV